MKRIACITLLIISIYYKNVTAQRMPNSLLEIGTSAASYKGDLGRPYSRYDMLLHAGLRMNKFKKLNFHLGITYGHITGQSTTFKPTDLTKNPSSYFRTTITALQAGLYLNILKTYRYNLFIGQEIGLLVFEPKDEQGRKLADIATTRAQDESYNTTALIFPTTLGTIYYFPNGFGIGTHLSLYNTITPYLDNINKLGGEKGHDNIYAWKFMFYIPLKMGKDEKDFSPVSNLK